MPSKADSSSGKTWVDPLSRIHQCSFFTSTTPEVNHLEAEDFHVLTAAEKNVIFAKHLPQQYAQQQRGEQILKRLKELAPSTAQHFHIKHDPTII